MKNNFPQDTWLDSGIFLEPVSEEGRQLWATCVELGKKYNIRLSTATESERQFIFSEAEKKLREKIAV